MAGFKAGEIRVLVATDVAARGIDIALLPHVVNFELPRSPADYVHRIGRTGRAGEEGQAISLVSHDEVSALRLVEKLIGAPIKREQIQGFEAAEIAPPMPPEPPRAPRPRRTSNQSRKPSGTASNKPRARGNV